MADKNTDKITQLFGKIFVDKGLLITSGWAALAAVDEDFLKQFSEEQKDYIKDCFFAGAQHLFASLCGIMSEEQVDPTEDDIRRMDQISDELNMWIETSNMTKRLGSRRS